MCSGDPTETQAPGRPGIPPRWTSSAKDGVGTALSGQSRLWFTLSHGILNEIYYPRLDLACMRDCGLIVTGGNGFFSEEKRHTRSSLSYLADGTPAYRLVNECLHGRYRIVKEVLADPQCETLLQRIRFTPLRDALSDYHVYVLLAPHLANRGSGNTAWIGDYKGVPMLFAQRRSTALSLTCSVGWLKRSAGFVGSSDGWQDLMQHGEMSWEYMRAEDGNVALIGEVNLVAGEGEFVLALGFGRNCAESAQRALASLQAGFGSVREEYLRGWHDWQKSLLTLDDPSSHRRQLYRTSAMVLRTHEAKTRPGGLIASLSIPWGFNKGDEDLGGYHLVWPRDLAEVAGGFLAIGARDEVLRPLLFLEITQEADGHWAQNMWLDGTPFWTGLQMDETAFPVLLLDLALREGVLNESCLPRYWPMVRRAAGFLARNGPVSQQDRWEEDPGYSPFTVAVEVAALLVAADLADRSGEAEIATYLRETADYWNANIERWTYVTGTDLAQRLGVDGYYVRIAPPDVAEAASPMHGFVPIKNRLPGDASITAEQMVSPDALALVRFGLRAPDDPRILNTIRVIDDLLQVQTPWGPAWRRYNGDGYGEREDGSPFDGAGIGRAWPLLAGERAHYELAAGHRQRAEELRDALEGFANAGGMIPEQIWDGADVPERELFFGRPTGSAMPLVWAHAEHVKLCRSLRDGRVFDTPPQTVRRYVVDKTGSDLAIWRFNQKIRTMPAGKTLRIELLARAVVHWSADNWHTVADNPTRDTGLESHLADLPTSDLAPGTDIVLTFYWPDSDRWESADVVVKVE